MTTSGRSLRRGEYSQSLGRLARYVLAHKALVVTVWVATAVVLAVLFPQLETVVRAQSVDPIPAGVPSFQALDRMGDAFGEKGAKTTVFVTMESSAGLTEPTRRRYDNLVARLQKDRDNVQSVRDLLADPITARQALSEDKKAWYLPVGVSGTLGGPEAADAVEALRRTAAQVFAGTDTTVHVTGPTATFTDQIAAAEKDLVLITLATVLLIAMILLVVYRSIFTALLPLLVIGISLAVGRGVLSALGELGMPVSQFTVAFMTVILLGAGVDYSVFLISRYHERLRHGADPSGALVDATATIGRVILASATTVALAFMAMVFGQLSVFATLGPACAVAIAVGFIATVTLLPPVLLWAARYGWGAPRKDLTRRYWNRIAVLVVRRPVPLLAAGLVGLSLLSVIAIGIQITYDDRDGQPSTTDSNQGYALLNRHFPRDITIAEFIVISAPTDLRTAKGLADLEQMASRIAQVPGVTRVVGVTRPTGAKLDQAKLSFQNGQIGNRVSGAVREGQARKGDLEQLRSGADQLADGLGQLDEQIRTNLTPLSGILDQVSTVDDNISQYRPLLQSLTDAAPQLDQAARSAPQLSALAQRSSAAIATITSVLPLLDNSPLCTQVPQCNTLRQQARDLAALRDNGFFTQITTLSTQLTQMKTPITTVTNQLNTTIDTLETTLGTIQSQDIPSKIAQLQTGVAQLAAGARTLAGGVSTLVDSNMQQLAGMATLAAQLQTTARETEGSDSATGFYLPKDAFNDQQFSDVARQFVSADGHTVRYAVQTRFDPYSSDAMRLASTIATVANDARPNTTLTDSTVSVAGFPAINADLQRLLTSDFRLLAIATLAIVGLVLMLLLRSLVAPIYLLGTVILNYTAALGVGVLIFQHLLHTDIAWPVPLLAFIVLVAVGADYNMLLVSRLREESQHNIRIGVLRTVTNTGSVITSAGLIFAASMFGLIFGSIGIMTQVGLIIGVGLLIDTFIVRTIVVPAIATLLGNASWWPQKAR
ncbi:RND family transporter [Williamsia sp. MIQD14]|uniref:MMPL/RND family transporter n=1 Tax=Williamsia sp. MIQD14 TaxID=3425703 RepID=UPI003DA0C36F